MGWLAWGRLDCWMGLVPACQLGEGRVLREKGGKGERRGEREDRRRSRSTPTHLIPRTHLDSFSLLQIGLEIQFDHLSEQFEPTALVRSFGQSIWS